MIPEPGLQNPMPRRAQTVRRKSYTSALRSRASRRSGVAPILAWRRGWQGTGVGTGGGAGRDRGGSMETEVGRLAAGWRRALPDVDVSPLEVLSRVGRLARHLERQGTVVFAGHDLETWTFDVQ